MAFVFTWPTFSQPFITSLKTHLTSALNKSQKPSNIVSEIQVVDVHLGTVPPELEILELVELTADKFRGIFKFSSEGDAYITLQTHVQVNPMVEGHAHSKVASSLSSIFGFSSVAASTPLIVPLQLKISRFRLNGLCSLVVDKVKGITLAFKNDPLEHVQVSSSFDEMSKVREFLQSSIESLIRHFIQEEVPSVVHAVSLSYLHEHSLLRHAESPTLEVPLSPNSHALVHAPSYQGKADLPSSPAPVKISSVTPFAWIGNEKEMVLELSPEDKVRLRKTFRESELSPRLAPTSISSPFPTSPDPASSFSTPSSAGADASGSSPIPSSVKPDPSTLSIIPSLTKLQSWLNSNSKPATPSWSPSPMSASFTSAPSSSVGLHALLDPSLPLAPPPCRSPKLPLSPPSRSSVSSFFSASSAMSLLRTLDPTPPTSKLQNLSNPSLSPYAQRPLHNVLFRSMPQRERALPLSETTLTYTVDLLNGTRKTYSVHLARGNNGPSKRPSCSNSKKPASNNMTRVFEVDLSSFMK